MSSELCTLIIETKLAINWPHWLQRLCYTFEFLMFPLLNCLHQFYCLHWLQQVKRVTPTNCNISEYHYSLQWWVSFSTNGWNNLHKVSAEFHTCFYKWLKQPSQNVCKIPHLCFYKWLKRPSQCLQNSTPFLQMAETTFTKCMQNSKPLFLQIKWPLHNDVCGIPHLCFYKWLKWPSQNVCRIPHLCFYKWLKWPSQCLQNSAPQFHSQQTEWVRFASPIFIWCTDEMLHNSVHTSTVQCKNYFDGWWLCIHTAFWGWYKFPLSSKYDIYLSSDAIRHYIIPQFVYKDKMKTGLTSLVGYIHRKWHHFQVVICHWVTTKPAVTKS